VWFQSLQLSSTQSETHLALIPLLLNPTCLFKVCNQHKF
jgi:hypothetical protein